ncbi:MAG: hypothetical protein JJU41_12960 [Bacteroidetes bacterium]|nr:hypothetical protein [Bacteroidota bacterium]MCH8525088.1 hypothetical protein [Balneolales bacterium]
MRLSLLPILFLIGSMLFGIAITADAQLRKDLPSAYRLTGPTLMTDHNQRNSSRLFNMVNVTMGHSYEMSMSTFGGNVYNQNMYTNTLFLDFNENFAGRVDVAFAHSPFGQGLPGMNQSGQIFVRNAEFNYRINERTQINFQFRQIPGGMGHRGFGHPYGYNSGFGRGWGYDPFYPF